MNRPPAERLGARSVEEIEGTDEEQRDARHLVREHAQRVERRRAGEGDRRSPAIAADADERDESAQKREVERDGVEACRGPETDRVCPREDERKAGDAARVDAGHRYRAEEEVTTQAADDAEHEREDMVSPEMVAEERMWNREQNGQHRPAAEIVGELSTAWKKRGGSPNRYRAAFAQSSE